MSLLWWHCTPGETPPTGYHRSGRASTSCPARRHARVAGKQAGGEEESELWMVVFMIFKN